VTLPPSLSSTVDSSLTTSAPLDFATSKVFLQFSTAKATSLTPSPCLAICALCSSPKLVFQFNGEVRQIVTLPFLTTCVTLSLLPVSKP